ncbi:CPSF A subunit region family protein [Trichomonas vaginalis G3]|uniref:CPSF A subunit region family protein n=1 Tax=Trichomonas vaginalis (strain ATCC PRA-98 / G3) TaxID=412133 RepID=A2D9V0_TRIV3|nr:DNA repair/RNA processing CPSF family [Trichomonas vaginalis G3]EAY22956.1 CPSF A subunit region family protein [Trichomonas vaginalis G3]KAI5527292.1 DNA repair/RNA processing CPSF family [Trichomonas vaginalis G3]|eukprot:XP_001583942.1 CPSF A subunit region family protein [Trichomonas vaginalis G3]
MNVTHRTICDSPAPESAIRCHLPFSKADCIVTANGNKLQVYSTKEDDLRLVWEKKFWGEIFGVYRHKSGGEYDSIIVGCDTSKVIVLQVIDNDLKETEYHEFNRPGPPEPDPPKPERPFDISTRLRNKTIMDADPTGTCLALLLAQNILYVLPLANKIKIESTEKAGDEYHSSWKVIKDAFAYDVHTDFKSPLYRIRDMVFLDGYKNPTLAIIHELIPTWSVRLPLQKSTVAVSIVSPPLKKKETVLISASIDKVTMWTSRALPHNSFGLVHVPDPIGGFLVLSKNAIIYMDHTNIVALALNKLAYLDDEVPVDITANGPGCHELYSKVGTAIDKSHILLTVDQHYLSILTLHYNGVKVTNLSLNVNLNLEFHPSCFLSLNYTNNRSLVFMGSTTHDSTLSEIILEIEEEELASFLVDHVMTETQNDLYQKFFKSLPRPKTLSKVKSFSVNNISYIRQLGTVANATPCLKLSQIDENEEQIAMALACGFKKYGCLHFVRSGIDPNLVSEFNIRGVTGIYSSENFSYILISTDEGTSVLYADSQNLPEINDEFTSQVSKEKTLFAGDFNNFFIQITKTVVRAIKYSQEDGFSHTDLYSGSSPAVLDARISSNALVVLFDNYTICAYDRALEPMTPLTNKYFSRIAIFGKYLFVYCTNGVLRMFSVETMTEVATFDNFKAFPDFIAPLGKDEIPLQPSSIGIVDISFVVFESVVLLVLTPRDGPAFFYQWVESKLFFRRIKMHRFAVTSRKNIDIIPFNGISDVFDGCFVTDPSNPFFILSENGYPRIIPLSESFNCKPRAFAPVMRGPYKNHFLIADEDQIRLCNLENIKPEHNFFIIDGCIVERIPVGMTVRRIAYCQNPNCVAFIASHPEPFTTENEKKIDVEVYENLQVHYQEPPSPAKVYPDEDYETIPKWNEERYSLFLYTKDGLQQMVDYANHEIVNTVQFVHTTPMPEDGITLLNTYLAVGSGFLSQPEKMMRGVLYIYQIRYMQNDEGFNEITLRPLYNETNKIYKNPIIEITDNSGYMAIFCGNLLYLMRFFNENTVKIEAFLVGRFFASSIVSLKNYLLYADSYEGFEVARWRKYGKKLISMARDTMTKLPLSAAFLQYEDCLGGVVFDDDGNAHIFDVDEYAIPADAVVRKSIFYIGGRAISSGQFPIKAVTQATQQNPNEEIDEELLQLQTKIGGHIAWYVTTHGKIGAFTPIDENDRHKLVGVQSAYEKSLCGLSHLEYRSGKFKNMIEQDIFNQSPKNVIDCDMLIDLIEDMPDHLKFATKGLRTQDFLSELRKIYNNGVNVFQ